MGNNTINLTKGNSISLTKSAPNINQFLIGASWEERTTEGEDFDLDLMAVLLNENGKVRNFKDCFFYGLAKNQGDPFETDDGALRHNGDNLVGGSSDEEDSEQILLNTSLLPKSIEKIVVLLAIYDAENRRQNFGSVRNAKLRIADAKNPNKNIVTMNLTEDFGGETIINAVEIYRYQGEWKVKNVQQGYAGGIVEALTDYGLNVE